MADHTIASITGLCLLLARLNTPFPRYRIRLRFKEDQKLIKMGVMMTI
jgi:hypothetical protein